MSRRIDIAWAAGLFEGEGYVHVTKEGSSPQIGLNMNDRDVVEKFQGIVGFGKIRIYDPKIKHHKRQYRWRATGWEHFEVFVAIFYPLLGKRRRSIIDAARVKKPETWTPVHITHCKHGHELTPENTAVYKQSHHGGLQRRCRACDKRRRRKRTERTRAAA